MKLSINSPSQPIGEILEKLPTNQKFQMVIVNRTRHSLVRSGVFNKLSNWGLDNVPPLTAEYRDWTEPGAAYFTYGANYAVGDTGRFFQFAAAYPPIGKRKIHVCRTDQGGDKPAYACWDVMYSNNDISETNGSFSVSATLISYSRWIYQVKET